MPTFRQRPLTWLFFIALACLNVVALAGEFQTDWYSDLIVAQVYIAAGWLALGRAHRLARAGALAAVLLGSVLPDYLMDPTGWNVWRYMLGSLLVMAVAAAASCGLCLGVARAVDPRRAPWTSLWRFSTAEVLGWMILVAIGSAVVPGVVFHHLSLPDSHWVPLVVASAVAGLGMTLLLGRTPLGAPASVAVAMVALAAVAVYISRLAPYDYLSVLRAYVVVAVWILVQRLDDSRSAVNPAPADAAGPAIKIFDAESDDHRRLG